MMSGPDFANAKTLRKMEAHNMIFQGPFQCRSEGCGETFGVAVPENKAWSIAPGEYISCPLCGGVFLIPKGS